MTTQEKMARRFALGREVSWLLSGQMRPNPKALKVAAECLRITQAEARRAFDLFMNGEGI